MYCEHHVLRIRQNKLSGVAEDFFLVMFLVVDGIVTTKTIVTPFSVIFEAMMTIFLRRRRIIVSRMINARTILIASSNRRNDCTDCSDEHDQEEDNTCLL